MTALVTGVTGLVGCHVAIDMLRNGTRVVALARHRRGNHAHARVNDLLRDYPGWQPPRQLPADVDVVTGDLLEPLCGVAPPELDRLRGTVDVVVNCAGEAVFPREGESLDALRVNSEGVGNVVALARALGCPRVVHVSTAFVDQGARGAGFRTDYEETKLEGERILRAHCAEAGIQARILRPSIVTGDQVHGFTPKFRGAYPFLRLAAESWTALRDFLWSDCLPETYHRGGLLDLVPADVVAAAVRGMAENGSGPHDLLTLTNPSEWPIPDFTATVNAAVRALLPQEEGEARAGRAEAACLRRKARILHDVYRPYLGVRLRATPDSGDALEEIAGLPAFSNSSDWIHALLDWCVKTQWRERA